MPKVFLMMPPLTFVLLPLLLLLCWLLRHFPLDLFANCTVFYYFQENLLHTMMQIESTFFDLAAAAAERSDKNVLVICDRGTMDASAFISR